jgi:hypothetical protein
LAEYPREAFDHVAGRQVDVGEQVRQELAAMLGSLANDVDALPA